MLSVPGSAARLQERNLGVMKRAQTSIKLCKCGHGKSIHAGIFQRKRTGPAKCNYPDCRCSGYRPVPASAMRASKA